MTDPYNGSNATNVVEAHQWLADTIETLIDEGKFVEAMRALSRLRSVADDTPTRLFCYENLGVLAYRAGDVDEARQAFERAASLKSNELSAGDPGLLYALGHCAAAHGEWWRALLHYLTAFHNARDRVDEAEFMRTGAIAMQQLGFPDTALSMFLGALDRSPDNPWILESISHFYEGEGRWFEALDVQEALIDVLADGLPSASSRLADHAQVDRLIRRFISLWTIDRQAVEKRVHAITDRLRAEIGLVRDDDPGAPMADAGLMSLNLPAGLHLLVEQLAAHERNFLLLETAQSLWAQARHDRFDVHLTPYTLAGAIQAVCERLHWRQAASFDELAEIYGADADTIQAATRLIAGRYGVRFVPEHERYGGLDAAESRRLVQIQRAILYGVDVRELEGAVAMLGD
ncbi:tetratricopeptide repeat protein [Persicimonas caeni]|nr:tetratricopeptide repeat protein [Persicimonas caeni]